MSWSMLWSSKPGSLLPAMACGVARPWRATLGTVLGPQASCHGQASLADWEEIDRKGLVSTLRLPLICQRYNDLAPSWDRVLAHFNGAVTTWKGKRRLAYRVETKPWFAYTQLYVVELDARDRPKPRTNKPLLIQTQYGDIGAEDPRFFEYQGALYMSWTDGKVAGVSRLTDELDVMWSEALPHPARRPLGCGLPRRSKDHREKNWIFFPAGDELVVKLWTHPHWIQRFDLEGRRLGARGWKTDWQTPWRWGEMHGGTTPVMHDGLLWSFFHSHHGVTNTMGARPNRYFMGVYAFDPTPPFRVRWCSKEPLAVGWEEPKMPERPSHHQVVFPTMAEITKDGWRVWMGVNDCRIGSWTISQQVVEASLVKT